MEFEKILKKARTQAKKADISGVDFLAVQINITDEDNPGVFYVEVKDRNINVEPYEYYDRQCMISIDSATLDKIMRGKADPVKCYDEGTLRAEGDLDKALTFTNLLTASLKK